MIIENPILERWFLEDGLDITSQATIPADKKGYMHLLVKENCTIAGIAVIQDFFGLATVEIEYKCKDGDYLQKGDIAFIIWGDVRFLLKIERPILNMMQRMSGIATKTQQYVQQLKGLHTKVCDTRKTTPGFRRFEKMAVAIGGGENHRFGLNDMFMIKDNHVDFCGTISKAIEAIFDYKENNPKYKSTRIACEARTLKDVGLILKTNLVDRIMLDNFSIEDTRTAMVMISNLQIKPKVESTGGINLGNVRDYAECGVDFISVGDLTHHINSIDLSLKFTPNDTPTPYLEQSWNRGGAF
jgi:nicotinate-nucleotide pyrophosphorylase (carboxylating)